MTTTRRHFLSSAATFPVAAAVIATPNLPAIGMPTETRTEASGPDAAVLDAFRRWVSAQRSLQAIAPAADEDEFEEACEACDVILEEMAALPAVTAAGFAVKVYATAHAKFGGTRADYARVLMPADDESEDIPLTMLKSALKDAGSVVPELGAILGAS